MPDNEHFRRSETFHKRKSEYDKAFFQHGTILQTVYIDWYLTAVFRSARHLVRAYIYATWKDCPENLVFLKMKGNAKLNQRHLIKSYKVLETFKDALQNDAINFTKKDCDDANEAYDVIESAITPFFFEHVRPLQ